MHVIQSNSYVWRPNRIHRPFPVTIKVETQKKSRKANMSTGASHMDHANRGIDCFAFHAQRDTQMLSDYPLAAACRKQAYNDDRGYVPVNFIPDTVYEMFEAWELSQQQYRVEMSESKTLTAENLSTYGAGQQVRGTTTMSADSPPPKLFYRTFWRSIARRLMDYKK